VVVAYLKYWPKIYREELSKITRNLRITVYRVKIGNCDLLQLQEVAENCIMRSFITCALRQM
jgi:hypothetical protein